MYVLKKYADNVDIPDTTDFSRNPETFEWKFDNYYTTYASKMKNLSLKIFNNINQI